MMELLILGGLVGGLCWLIRQWPARQPTSTPSPQELQRRAAIARQQQELQLIRRRQAQQAADRRRQLAARNMQVAILQVDQSPDFRRAASHAELARDVPLAFRQKQFRRLRPLLLRHLVTKLRAGHPVEAAAAGLTELVTALGIADYEAEYLIQEASTAGQTRAAAPTSFADQAQQWQRELRQRLETIQGLNDLDPDLREQLIEQEQQRFRERMIAAGDPTPSNDRLQRFRNHSMPTPTPSRFVETRRGTLPSPEELFAESAAGLAVSGDSGTGKSTLLLGLMRSIIAQGFGLTLLDPHGDLASDLERHCASLPERIRSKIVVLRFHETKRLPALNPLAVDYIAGDEFRRRAMIASKVGHVGKILLHAWGESGTASRPTLAKWLNRFLTMLARCGLTIPDVRHFFDTASPVYHALTAAAPDFVSRLEMEQLADLRPREREDEIASTKNRCLGYLSNPIVEHVLGSPEHALSFRNLIQQQGVLIVDLSRGGVLRDEDVEIFANLILHEVLYAAFNMPRAERAPHFVFADELPVFASSFDLITWALTQVRKFKLRFCCAFQGTQLFEERTEDRLLNALIGQCNAHVIFRHKNPVDARFFADIVQLPSADPWKIKHVLKTPQQYQDGHDLVTLIDEAENWSDANQTGSGESTATSDTRTESSGSTNSRGATTTESEREGQLRNAVSRARSETTGTSRGESTARGRTQTTTHSSSTTSTRGGGRTFKQSLVPRVKTRDIVSSIQFLTLDEQIAQVASEIARLPIGSALLNLAGRVARVRFPLPRDPLARTPNFAQKKLAELARLIHTRPEFQSPTERAEARLRFEQRLIEHLHGLASTEITPRVVLLPRSTGDEHLTI